MEGRRQESRRDTGRYRRDAATWAGFAALFGFGFLNAALGPALPFIRAAEDISYLVGSLHQVAYAVGGGLAGVFATRTTSRNRRAAIAVGLCAAALSAVLLGYGETAELTILAALLMSMFGTWALIRIWAAFADIHGLRRAVALSEGEVSVSLAGIVTPLLIGALAASALSWRFAFIVGAIAVIASAAAVARVRIPPARPRSDNMASTGDTRPEPTLLAVLGVVALEFSLSFWLASYLNDSVELRRDIAVAMVSGLYAANLVGRLLASRAARRLSSQAVLAAALMLAFVGLPILLAATGAAVAAIGIAVAGMGIGATFPLISAMHIESSPRGSDQALGQILAVAALGQVMGPLSVGVIAQLADLRVGLAIALAYAALASGALILVRRRTAPDAGDATALAPAGDCA